MGYGYRSGWGDHVAHSGIRTFWPDDTDSEIYISCPFTLEEIQALIADK